MYALQQAHACRRGRVLFCKHLKLYNSAFLSLFQRGSKDLYDHKKYIVMATVSVIASIVEMGEAMSVQLPQPEDLTQSNQDHDLEDSPVFLHPAPFDILP